MSDRRAPTVHVVIGNPRAGGRTTRAGLAVGEALTAFRDDLSVELLELADYAGEMFDWDAVALGEHVERITAATALVVASPTFKASYTGLLKAFLDRFPAGSLTGVTTVPLMVGAGPHHALAVETQLRPVLVELGATMPTAGLFVVDSDLDRIGETVAAWVETHRQVLSAQLAG